MGVLKQNSKDEDNAANGYFSSVLSQIAFFSKLQFFGNVQKCWHEDYWCPMAAKEKRRMRVYQAFSFGDLVPLARRW
jgi:hypothetical protein